MVSDNEEVEDRYQKIGEAIKMARIESGMSEKHLGKIVGMSRRSIQHREMGTRKVAIDELEKIAAVLKKPLEFFLSYGAITYLGRYNVDLLDLVRKSLDEMETFGFPVGWAYNTLGESEPTHLHRLFKRIVYNSGDMEKDVPFDRMLGGIEDHSDLVDLLLEYFKKETGYVEDKV